MLGPLNVKTALFISTMLVIFTNTIWRALRSVQNALKTHTSTEIGSARLVGRSLPSVSLADLISRTQYVSNVMIRVIMQCLTMDRAVWTVLPSNKVSTPPQTSVLRAGKPLKGVLSVR